MKVISRQKVADFIHHIVYGYTSSHEGIVQLHNEDIISTEEFNDMVEQNVARLNERVSEFKLREKILCLALMALMTFSALTNPSQELRRPTRSRTRKEVTK